MKPVVEKPAEDEGEGEGAESDRTPRFIRGALGIGGAFIYKGVAILRWSLMFHWFLLTLFPLTLLLLLLRLLQLPKAVA